MSRLLLLLASACVVGASCDAPRAPYPVRGGGIGMKLVTGGDLKKLLIGNHTRNVRALNGDASPEYFDPDGRFFYRSVAGADYGKFDLRDDRVCLYTLKNKPYGLCYVFFRDMFGSYWKAFIAHGELRPFRVIVARGAWK